MRREVIAVLILGTLFAAFFVLREAAERQRAVRPSCEAPGTCEPDPNTPTLSESLESLEATFGRLDATTARVEGMIAQIEELNAMIEDLNGQLEWPQP